MSITNPQLDSLTACMMQKLSNSIDQQSAATDKMLQCLSFLMKRFDSMEARVNNIETHMAESATHPKPICPTESSSQNSSGSQHHAFIPRNENTTSQMPQPKPKTTWAAIANKPPPTHLTDRKRQALHLPPNGTTDNGSYSIIYIPRSRRINRAQIRSKFREISIDNLRVLDLTFPARNTISVVLLDEAYLPEFQSKLLEIDTNLIENFDPLNPIHIADPKYQNLSQDRRIQLAKALQQDRCIRTLYFIRPHLVPGVAKYFIRQGWVPSPMANDIINQRLPRPTKRRPEPHSFVAKTLQGSQSTNTRPLTPMDASSQGTLPQAPLQDWYRNTVPTQDMHITPDFASNASAEEGSRPASPISDTDDLSQAVRSSSTPSTFLQPPPPL